MKLDFYMYSEAIKEFPLADIKRQMEFGDVKYYLAWIAEMRNNKLQCCYFAAAEQQDYHMYYTDKISRLVPEEVSFNIAFPKHKKELMNTT